jgi:hypothetical protein
MQMGVGGSPPNNKTVTYDSTATPGGSLALDILFETRETPWAMIAGQLLPSSLSGYDQLEVGGASKTIPPFFLFVECKCLLAFIYCLM